MQKDKINESIEKIIEKIKPLEPTKPIEPRKTLTAYIKKTTLDKIIKEAKEKNYTKSVYVSKILDDFYEQK